MVSTQLPRPELTWNPGLANGERRLRDVYRGMPGSFAAKDPWYVRALEQRSPLALPHAVDRFARDCLHIVLGRGLLPQDEAFVLGFTVGAAKVSGLQRQLFRLLARRLYSKKYRFPEQDADVFDFAFTAAERSSVFALHRVDFRRLLDRPLAEVRRFLGIDEHFLRQVYAEERRRWPSGQASARLWGSSYDDDAPKAGRLVRLSDFRSAELRPRLSPAQPFLLRMGNNESLGQVVVASADRLDKPRRFQ